MSLTDKQEAFVLEYLKDFNALQAAIRAGYSEASAGSIGHENLNKPEIQKRIKEHLEVAGANTNRVIGELIKIAFADAQDYVDIDEDTGAIRVKGFEQMPHGASRTIKKVKETRKITETKDGERLFVDTTTELEHHDKLKALELLGKHLGVFKESIQLSGLPGGLPVEVTFKAPENQA